MADLAEEFERTLNAWRIRYAGRPQDELMRLLFLAVEREQFVSIAYREQVIIDRLASMSLVPEIRRLIHHALIWVWKDEEMHAIFIRGLLVKFGSRSYTVRAFTQQIAGAIAGWATAARQHLPWSRAPLSRVLAACITWAGVLLGRVPRKVRRHLRYGTFQDFCRFNIDAERTASLGFARMAELMRDHADLSSVAQDIERIRQDEERHLRIFTILVECMLAQDRFDPSITAEVLAARIAQVGAHFIPRERRLDHDIWHPLGTGGPVWVACDDGALPIGKEATLDAVLVDAGLGKRLQVLVAARGIAATQVKIVIKTTFMMGYHVDDPSPITDPILVQRLIRFLRSLGYSSISVIEGPTIYDHFYQHRSVQEVAAYVGHSAPGVTIIDASQEQVRHAFGRGIGQYTVARSWKEADIRISFGKLTSHPIDHHLLSLGALERLGARCDEFLFIDRQIHRQTATMMMIDAFPPHLALLDGYDAVADGVVGMMGCNRPLTPRRLYAGYDAVAVDIVASRHLGLSAPQQSSILRNAIHWFGMPAGNIQVIGTDQAIAQWRNPYQDEWSSMLSLIAHPMYTIGSERGALFVPQMDERAFPAITKPRWWMRFRRAVVQRLLGLDLSSRRGRPGASPRSTG